MRPAYSFLNVALITDDGTKVRMPLTAFHQPLVPLIKAAGYIAHCRCGCVPPAPRPADMFNLTSDTPHQWEVTPDEPLRVYCLMEWQSGHLIRHRHCEAIAIRMAELQALAVRIEPQIAYELNFLIACLHNHARIKRDIIIH